MTKAEQETVIRWDREDRRVEMWTADPAEARRWLKLGYDVTIIRRSGDGAPTGWRATGPAKCIRFRRVATGSLVKRTNGGQNLSIHRQVRARTPRAGGQMPPATEVPSN